jgi:hypothetical protein
MIDLDAEMRFWLDVLGLESAGWKVTWGWVDSIPLDDGRSAFGLNTLDADKRESNIKIKKLATDIDRREFVDTCAHEMAHNFGAEIERRLLEAQSEQDRINAHEYIAETLAPALTRIKNTPREVAFAKALKSLSRKTEAFAKVVNQQLPARAKGSAMPIDPQKLAELAMRAGELKAMEGLPPEAAALLEEMIAMSAGGNGGGPESAPAAPFAAADPTATDKPEDKGPPPAAKPLEEQGYAKAFEVLVDAREDLKPRRADVLGYLKKHHKTVEGAAEYLKTIPLAKTSQEPKAPAAKPLDDKAPRPGATNGQMRLGKIDKESLLTVAKAMGQATEPVRGPTILTKADGQKAFTLGNMTPTQYRAKREAGWDPRKDFPLASEVTQ